jgi:hypothetical protein
MQVDPEPTMTTTPPPTNDPPNPAKARASAGMMLAGVGTLLTIAVGGSQLVINGMQIREKVAVKPATSTPVEHGELTPGTGRAPRSEADSSADSGPSKIPELDNNVGLLGGDADSSTASRMPLAWLDYPLAEGQAIPAPLAAPVHRLFVALEEGIRNAGDYTYIVYLPDTEALRQMKKPSKDGMSIPLIDGDSGTTLSVLLTQELWERIQHAEGQQVVLIACVCVAPDCQAPILDWEMVRKALDDKSVQTTSIHWDGVAKGEPVTLVRDSGVTCTIPGPLILALVTPKGA